MDASNGRATRITTQPQGDDREFAEAPAWSPDGRRVAFVRTGPPEPLFVSSQRREAANET
ncbi:MAG: PD40 domain-containing protein [Actinobacteria bacterium]|nr:PD40 domain-containing protein [Actinomycetota bacterium]